MGKMKLIKHKNESKNKLKWYILVTRKPLVKIFKIKLLIFNRDKAK